MGKKKDLAPRDEKAKALRPTIKASPEVRVVDLSTLKPATYNPRAIAPDALAALRRSMERYGYADLIVANKRTGTVIGGHQRLQVLIGGGVRRAQVVFVDLDEKAERELNVILNSPSIAGDFTADLEGLIKQFRIDLPTEDFDALRFDDLEFPSQTDFDPVSSDQQSRLDEKAKIACPECGHEFAP